LRVLPATSSASVDGNTASGEFREQFANSRGRFAIAGHDHGPFQIFAKFFFANPPLAKRM